MKKLHKDYNENKAGYLPLSIYFLILSVLNFGNGRYIFFSTAIIFFVMYMSKD